MEIEPAKTTDLHPGLIVAATSPQYRLRNSPRPFLLAVCGTVMFPALPVLGLTILGLALLVMLVNPGYHQIRAIRIGVALAIASALYALLARGDLAPALVFGFFSFTIGATGSIVGLGNRNSPIEHRLISLYEAFLYANLLALQFNLVAPNENRLFRSSTVGSERLSFYFASNPAQAAVAAGACILLVLTPVAQIRPARRYALIATSTYLVWGANYRNVAALLLVATCLVIAYRSRYGSANSRRRSPAWIGVAATALAVLPLWWSPVSSLIASPAAVVFEATPGLGGRRASVSVEQEISTLNSRTLIWSETWRLFHEAGPSELVVGYGPGTSGDQYEQMLQSTVGSSFDDLSFISAHNSSMEMARRAGLLGIGLALGGLVFFWRARCLTPIGMYLSASLIVATTATDPLLTPYSGITLAAFTLVCVAPDPQARIRETDIDMDLAAGMPTLSQPPTEHGTQASGSAH